MTKSPPPSPPLPIYYQSEIGDMVKVPAKALLSGQFYIDPETETLFGSDGRVYPGLRFKREEFLERASREGFTNRH